MWDFAWLHMHHPGGAFENFDRSMDELVERGFNTVRIDAFPLIIGKLDSLTQKITIAAQPTAVWGPTQKEYQHEIVKELVAFMQAAKRKKVNVILSTWNVDCKEFAPIRAKYTKVNAYWSAWQKVLTVLKNNNLLDIVTYVDLDQEFPFWSPFKPIIDILGVDGAIPKPAGTSAADGYAAALQDNNGELTWNKEQYNYVRNHINYTLTFFQATFPELKFTFSFTEYWQEFRSMNLKNLDVLELHIWLSQSPRFNNRTQFNFIRKDRDTSISYAAYQSAVNDAMKSMKPMFLKEMHNRMAYARAWSDEIAAPLTTTESWGPWWHMDTRTLDWKWMESWSEECMKIAAGYGFWGVTPWNYAEPYWANWKNVEWYKKVNLSFSSK